jgi:type IV secretory pathway TraG/TraD family ATPase VirD4
MRKLLAAIGGGVAALAVPYGWIVTASAIYCAGVGRPALFASPFTQWLDVLPSWRANWWVTLWVVLGAAVPTAAMAAIAHVAVIVWRRNAGTTAVYGKTNWASRRQMGKANISTSRRPF